MVVVVLMLNQLKLSKEGGVVIARGGIDCIKLLSANKGRLKKAEHNLTTYSGYQELTKKKQYF